jgi:ketosteroid isomerase-like protein
VCCNLHCLLPSFLIESNANRVIELSHPTNRPNPREKTMKICLIVALAGFAISFALPTIAQQTNTPDPQLRQKLVDAIKRHTDSLDENDATAIAANFTENGILVTPDGSIFGREAIEKHFADDFKQGFRSSKNTATPDDDSPHIIGTDSNEMWATGKWTATVQGKDWGPVDAKGYWSVIREGDDWKIRMLAYNVTPAPAAK